ncbi:MAG: TPM domain-containing protein [Bacteroidales bacterium]
MKASSFFTKEQKAHILDAIKKAEKETSGEIRVHIETRHSGDVLDRASWIFKKLGMLRTKDRNGVLFYLAIKNRKFAVIGDIGINAKVPDGFWDKIRDIMEADFREKRFTEGLVKGILMTGTKLKEYFPHQINDINELPDEISFDDPDKTVIG